MKKLLITILLLNTYVSYSQGNIITIKKSIFDVRYSQDYEQPIALWYRSTNRATLVNRAGLDFHKEATILTSDVYDYYNNVYDKGHLAPAATFSDNIDNLTQTFSYLNCSLQDQDLNRGEWRLLEEQERKWDNKEPLTVIVTLKFDKPVKRILTNAAIPSYMNKHIYFERSKIWKCYSFKNEKPVTGWEKHLIQCDGIDHKF